MLPNFVMIGSPKCGSTTLSNLLMQHPEIFIPEQKELYFFCPASQRTLEWYESIYADAKGNKFKAIGDCTVNYTNANERNLADPQNIKGYLGSASIIYLVRNPIARIESAYLQAVRTGHYINIPRDFNTAIKQKNSILIDTTKYWFHLDRYSQYFDNILILFYEDLVKEPLKVIQTCFSFLDVDPSFIPQELSIHLNKTYGEGIKTDTKLIGNMRKIKQLNSIKSALPKAIRNILSNSLKQPIERPKWKSESIQIVHESLYEESIKFLKYFDKPSDFWDWNSYLKFD